MLREQFLDLAPMAKFVEIPRKLEPGRDQGSSSVNVIVAAFEYGSRLFGGIRKVTPQCSYSVKSHIVTWDKSNLGFCT